MHQDQINQAQKEEKKKKRHTNNFRHRIGQVLTTIIDLQEPKRSRIPLFLFALAAEERQMASGIFDEPRGIRERKRGVRSRRGRNARKGLRFDACAVQRESEV